MDTDNLQKTLAKLHEELQRAPYIDPESRQLLQQIMRDAERLGQPEQARDRAGAAAAVPRQHRLEALAVHFEAEHPTLATTLREFIELLVQAGV